MGDWREPRPGLTKNERGIPITILDALISDLGFKVIRRSFSSFPMLPKISARLGVHTFDSKYITYLDAILCRLFGFNTMYHRVSLLDKLGPNAVFYILEK